MLSVRRTDGSALRSSNLLRQSVATWEGSELGQNDTCPAGKITERGQTWFQCFFVESFGNINFILRAALHS